MKSQLPSLAFQVFDELSERNVVTWSSMISGCVFNEKPKIGIFLFLGMMESGVMPNDFTFNAVLQACAAVGALNFGVQVHSLIIRLGMQQDNRIGNCLVEFYLSCRSMEKAVLVFDLIPDPDVVSFTCLIKGFCKNNLPDQANELFFDMVLLGIDPNARTFTTVLTGCDLILGKQIHGYMIKSGIQTSNFYCSSALIELYSRNGLLVEARKIFHRIGEEKSVITWSSMISCCIRDGKEEDAVKLFMEMINISDDSPKPNEYTYATIIGGCGNHCELLVLGIQLHGCIIKLGFSSDNRICNSLISMYAKNRKIKEAEELFERFTSPDAATWTGMISGYFQNGFHEKSARFLCQMHQRGIKPNEYAFSSSISSCGNLSLLDQGTQIHALVIKSGCDRNLGVENSLISMYSKCGCIIGARLVFDEMPTRDLTSWNSLILGYAHAGLSSHVLKLFKKMPKTIQPDETTYLSVITACSHAGKPEESLRHLSAIENPSLPLYICAIDALGRAGNLTKAMRILDEMPFEADDLAWKTLLAACRKHDSLELGEMVAKKVMEMAPEDSAGYILLSNLHASRGKWEDVRRVRTMMDERGVRKEAAWSWIEVGNQVHAFVSMDKSHPYMEAIYGMLEGLNKQMREEGYSTPLISADPCQE